MELHPKHESVAIWKDRFIAAVGALFVLAYMYGSISDGALELRRARSFDDVISGLMPILFALVVLGGGFMAFGFFWGITHAFLRLENGALEYRWTWWKWQHVQTVDLRTVTGARIEDYISVFRGRKTIVPSVIFTSKPNPAPLVPTSSFQDGKEDPHFPLPKGAPDQEVQLFLQKINQEIKRVNGGWGK